MGVNFKEALTVLYRALPLVLFRAGIFVAGGFLVIIIFGVLLFAFRPAGGANPVAALVVSVLAILGWWVSGRVLQRFFLYRQKAAMLLLFSGCSFPAPGLAMAINEAGRYFNNYSQWRALNRLLRLVLLSFRFNGEILEARSSPHSGYLERFADLLVAGSLSQAVLGLAFSRNGMNIWQSAHEGLALYFQHGNGSRRLACRWWPSLRWPP